MRQKPKLSAEDFKSPISLDTLAKGLAELPKMNDALRLAGMRDGIGLTQARAKSATRAELRAKARGDIVAGARAARAKSEATALAAAYQTEVARVENGLADMLTTDEKPTPKPDSYDLRGVIMTAQGMAAGCVDVSAALDDGTYVAQATTNSKGIFRMSVPVGTDKDEIPDGSVLYFEVSVDGENAQDTSFPAVIVTAGDNDDVILMLAAKPQDDGNCDWFSDDARPARKSSTRLPKRYWPWD